MKKRITIKINKFMIIVIFLLFCLAIFKLAFIIFAKKTDDIDLDLFAKSRNTTKQVLYAERGFIYDKNGEILARNINSYNVVACLDASKTTDENTPRHVIDKDMTAQKLSEILITLNKKMTKEYILGLLNRDAKQVELGPGGRNISEFIKEKIAKLNLPGISFITSSKRYYPMDSMASFIIGYAKKDETGKIIGEMGLEKQYNKLLDGEAGFKVYQKDAYGYQIPNTPYNIKDPVSGANIYLTLDNNIQLILEDAVRSFKDKFNMDWITITIADAKTGAILGSANDPNFNLNTLEGLESYINPLVGYQYEPGSTMKIFSWMAAIENGVYDGESLYQSGEIKIGPDVVHDSNRVGWGKISYDEGFIRSSNVAASNLALALGLDKMRSFYDSLGFGKKTNIELPAEVSGVSNFKYNIELASASFGQGIATTPIQNIQALTSIANNGIVVKPYIVEKIVNNAGEVIYQAKREEKERVASEETIKKVKELMWGVVNSNLTDAKYYQPNNVVLIGKTGTAQMANPKGGYLEGKYDIVKSFLGVFPYEEPKYIIYFSSQRLDGGYKQVATMVAGIVDAVAKKDKEINGNKSSVDKSKIITIENYLNKDIAVINEQLKAKNLTPVVLGDGERVIAQYPKTGTIVKNSTIVLLKTNSDKLIFPNVKGWTSSEIINFCKFIGLEYSIEGKGLVNSVDVPLGEVIDLNRPIKIKLM